MPQTVFNILTMILLTVVSVFSCSAPAPLLIAAGLLLMLETYASFDAEKNMRITAAKLVLTASFALLSGPFPGFCAFMLADEIRPLFRGLTALILYFVISALPGGQPSPPFAVTIIRALFLAALLLALYGVKYAIADAQKRRMSDADRLLSINLNELHTKRLNEQLIRNSYMADKNARLLERENISRNIHNSVGHSITAAIMSLDAADLLYDARPDDARQKMHDANERIRGSLDSIRRAVRMLDEDSQAVRAADLKCGMKTIIDNFMMDTERTVQYHLGEPDDDCLIPHEHAEFLTGVLEELLSNGVRHGQANFFTVLLSGDDAHIRLIVSDNGTGDFNESNRNRKIENGFGLKKMMAYAARCGGKTEFTNRGGFRSVVELPLPEQKEET